MLETRSCRATSATVRKRPMTGGDSAPDPTLSLMPTRVYTEPFFPISGLLEFQPSGGKNCAPVYGHPRAPHHEVVVEANPHRAPKGMVVSERDVDSAQDLFVLEEGPRNLRGVVDADAQLGHGKRLATVGSGQSLEALAGPPLPGARVTVGNRDHQGLPQSS